MIEVEVTEKMLAWAKRKEKAFKEGPHYNHDFEFEGNVLAGYVAEAAFWKNYPESHYCDASTHDFILHENRYDLKSYRSNYAPQPNYGVCVTEKDLSERGGSARYFWAVVTYDLSKVILLGWLPYDRFVEISVFKTRGMKLGEFEYPCDTWEVAISSLNPPMEAELAPPPAPPKDPHWISPLKKGQQLPLF